MNQYLLVPVAAVLLLRATAFGADNHRDGSWWRKQSELTKASYIVGVLDGVHLGHDFSTWGLVEDVSASDARQRTIESFEKYSKLLSRVRVGQLDEGLDAFYTDFRNRNIAVYRALWVVIRSITGTPQDEVDRLIENLRKSATQE